MLRLDHGTKRRGNDGLAFGAHVGHVVKVVGLHGKGREIAGNPAIFIGATNANGAVALATCLIELLG